ncbi:hypothetical protein BZZ01_32450 [Nostocales cyanobacterium HT-58-2]|nr:hypothetical protein BZZ01_32450 [Nostocales cyanobacterium HT-58-2]
MELEQDKVVSWKEILGNPYRYGLNSQMLLPNGYKHKGMLRVVGQRKSDDKIPATVCFDEDYVVSFLIKYVFEKLLPESYNDFQKIVSKAYKVWKSQQADK